MSEILLTCANADLAGALQTLNVPGNTAMFLERVPARWLDSAEVAGGIRLAAFDAATDWASWERGRVFCGDWELRWEGRQAVYTGLAVSLPDFVAGPALPKEVRQANYYLWGKRDGSRFIELQVARVLTYPVSAATRARLRAAEWLDASGEVVAWRCLGLEEAP